MEEEANEEGLTEGAALLKPLDGVEAMELIVTVEEGPFTVALAVVRKDRSKSVTEKVDLE